MLPLASVIPHGAVDPFTKPENFQIWHGTKGGKEVEDLAGPDPTTELFDPIDNPPPILHQAPDRYRHSRREPRTTAYQRGRESCQKSRVTWLRYIVVHRDESPRALLRYY